MDFFCKIYTTDGHKPAQSKVSAIVNMPAQTCKMQVQSFIGMVNYLSKFSARLSELVESIRELSKDKVPFNWAPEHQEAFKQMKREIVRVPILAYYNPKKELYCKQMQVFKDLVHACWKKRGLYTLSARPLQRHREAMWQLKLNL